MTTRNVKHLVLVPCHAVLASGGEADPSAERSWLLDQYKKGLHEGDKYVGHIREAIEIVASDPEALLVFSGGHTRPERPISEAASYYLVAEILGLISKISSRVALEEYARDSYENILFSICRFHEFTGVWPERVTVVGWSFKSTRYRFHADAIGWPRSRFEYVGANDPANLADSMASERRTLIAFLEDPHSILDRPVGSEPSTDKRVYLAEKRRKRDPHRRQPPYALTCPDLAPLLDHKSTDLYPGPRPWSLGGSMVLAFHQRHASGIEDEFSSWYVDRYVPLKQNRMAPEGDLVLTCHRCTADLELEPHSASTTVRTEAVICTLPNTNLGVIGGSEDLTLHYLEPIRKWVGISRWTEMESSHASGSFIDGPFQVEGPLATILLSAFGIDASKVDEREWQRSSPAMLEALALCFPAPLEPGKSS